MCVDACVWPLIISTICHIRTPLERQVICTEARRTISHEFPCRWQRQQWRRREIRRNERGLHTSKWQKHIWNSRIVYIWFFSRLKYVVHVYSTCKNTQMTWINKTLEVHSCTRRTPTFKLLKKKQEKTKMSDPYYNFGSKSAAELGTLARTQT